MAKLMPAAAQPLHADETRPLPTWEETRSRLEEAQFYWLATVGQANRPHVMPVLAVWLDGALYFSTAPATRKGRNLAHNTQCVLTVDSDDLHLVLEGEAVKVRNDSRLRRVASAYTSKYGWHVTVRDGALYADSAPTAGQPPYEVFAVAATQVFALGTDETFGAARWNFATMPAATR